MMGLMGKWWKQGRSAIPQTLNQADMIRLLAANGWTQESGGKHQVKMTKSGHRPITLPDHKRRDYPSGLREAILKQANIRREG